MKIFKRIVSCIILIALLFVTFFCATNLFEKKNSNNKYALFFKHPEDFDVLFFGTSHTIYSVYPMELWNDYGITSYNFGGHSNRIPTTYWVLRNVLDYAKPKVVFVDCFSIYQSQKTSDYYSLVHTCFDAFPLTTNKIKAINDLLDDKIIQNKIDKGTIEESEERTALGLLWDFSVYHSRWEELDEFDFNNYNSIEYGAESGLQIAKPGINLENNNKRISKQTTGIIYLKKIIEECKANSIEVVLTYYPYPVLEEAIWEEINTVSDIAKEYDVAYLDFMSMNLVDYNISCYDSNSHLNCLGAHTITDYIGNYLKSNYHILDHRNDSRYDYWDEDYQKYEKLKNERLGTIDDLNTYLMLLDDKNYGYIIGVGDHSIFENETTLNLLKNKGINIDELGEDTHYIMVCGEDSQVINEPINDFGDYGKVSIYFNDDNTYGVYKDGELFLLSTETLAIVPTATYVSVFDIDDRHNVIDISIFAKKDSDIYSKHKGQIEEYTLLNSDSLRIQ